jgi:hypothetical protein
MLLYIEVCLPLYIAHDYIKDEEYVAKVRQGVVDPNSTEGARNLESDLGYDVACVFVEVNTTNHPRLSPRERLGSQGGQQRYRYVLIIEHYSL